MDESCEMPEAQKCAGGKSIGASPKVPKTGLKVGLHEDIALSAPLDLVKVSISGAMPVMPPPATSEAQMSAAGETIEASPEVPIKGLKEDLLEDMDTATPLDLVTGTTILSGDYDFGILVGGDSLATMPDGTIDKEQVQKVFHLGGDPRSYMLYGASGTSWYCTRVCEYLITQIANKHRKGRVLTSKEGAKYAKRFLNIPVEILEKYVPGDLEFDAMTCGVTLGMFEPEKKPKSMKKHKSKKRTHEEVEGEEGQQAKFDPGQYFTSTEFITTRRAGLYFIGKDEEITKVEKFKVDGHEDGKAESYLADNYNRTHALETAVMHMEEAMVEGCESGNSGGLITIDWIDHNNTITNVCKKDIEQLRQEKLQREKAFYDANSKREIIPVEATYDMWG
ncbi:uncharacterized protein LOC113323911 isoform X2 [Papaver somniferum]|uniref:uncharacterized protein LOC113323911 isoform X1 n=1 Tax=Papaver somniferum TaxID=3469 RepID=UPI000E6F8347|nr:uncharacterized protein LOC113323911 isoform X1 [Papaver somniferum]XP_026428046.1 uncharacterized protein LOC113323911 isoform X2 [Papaver somniferum]